MSDTVVPTRVELATLALLACIELVVVTNASKDCLGRTPRSNQLS